VGKAELHTLLQTWLPRLADNGTAWLVVARNLGADSLQEWITARGYPAHRHGVLFIPGGTVHAARNPGNVKGSELATYIVEKGKPLLTLVK
jgi:hypothetical protein